MSTSRAAVDTRSSVLGEVAPYLVVTACLALVLLFLWPLQGDQHELLWERWRYPLPLTAHVPATLRLLLLVAVGGAAGGSLRTTLDAARSAAGRIRRGLRPGLPWTIGLVRVLTGGVAACVAWLVARTLFGLTDLAQLKLEEILAVVQLYKSLGGGWQ